MWHVILILFPNRKMGIQTFLTQRNVSSHGGVVQAITNFWLPSSSAILAASPLGIDLTCSSGLRHRNGRRKGSRMWVVFAIFKLSQILGILSCEKNPRCWLLCISRHNKHSHISSRCTFLSCSLYIFVHIFQLFTNWIYGHCSRGLFS